MKKITLRVQANLGMFSLFWLHFCYDDLREFSQGYIKIIKSFKDLNVGNQTVSERT